MYVCMTYVDLFHMSNASRSIYARIRGVQKNLSCKWQWEGFILQRKIKDAHVDLEFYILNILPSNNICPALHSQVHSLTFFFYHFHKPHVIKLSKTKLSKEECQVNIEFRACNSMKVHCHPTSLSPPLCYPPLFFRHPQLWKTRNFM